MPDMFSAVSDLAPAAAPVMRRDRAQAAPRSFADRDEFGPIADRPALFSAPRQASALAAREDLGHALCAWLPREDLL